MLAGRFDKRRRRDGKRKPVPGPTEAYETSWYRVLARQAEREDPTGSEEAIPIENERPGATPRRTSASTSERIAPALRLASSPELAPAAAPDETVRADRSKSASPGLEPEPPNGTAAPSAPSSTALTTVRIGVRRLDAPEGTYLRYLTRSPHAEFFRSDLWPSGRALTPVHLWRANHLGAGWEIDDVQRFLDGPAQRATQLVASAPATAPPGSPDRHTWIKRLFHSECVADFGLPRISKTLHPLLPNLVPDLDAEMTPWAAREWLGLRDRPAGPDDVDAWLEVWELMEDVMVVRASAFDEIVRGVRGRAQRRAPTGPLGLVCATFWESYWQEGRREPEPPVAPIARPKRPSVSTSRPKSTASPRTAAPRTQDPASEGSVAEAPRTATRGRTKASTVSSPTSKGPVPRRAKAPGPER